MQNVQLLT